MISIMLNGTACKFAAPLVIYFLARQTRIRRIFVLSKDMHANVT